MLYGAYDSHFVSAECYRKQSNSEFDELDVPCVGRADAGGDDLVGGRCAQVVQRYVLASEYG